MIHHNTKEIGDTTSQLLRFYYLSDYIGWGKEGMFLVEYALFKNSNQQRKHLLSLFARAPCAREAEDRAGEVAFFNSCLPQKWLLPSQLSKSGRAILCCTVVLAEGATSEAGEEAGPPGPRGTD
jgi:hypothetical protein